MPVGTGGQGLMGEREAPGDDVGEQAADMGPGEPARSRRGVGCSGEGAGEGTQGGAEVAGVAEDLGDGLGHGTGVAEPAAGQVAFVVAVQAGEVAGDAGAVPADRCLAVGAAAG